MGNTNNKGKKQLNILCFGDSLTKGTYTDPKTLVYESAPYGNTLEKLIQRNLAANSENGVANCILNIIITGVNGEKATDMPERLKFLLQENKPKKQNKGDMPLPPYFDYAILMGGTNDLGWGIDHTDIIAAITELHTTVLESHPNCKTVAITVPETQGVSDNLLIARAAINTAIANFAEKNEGKVILCDLHKQLPFASLSERDRFLLWSDGVHFTPKGYEKMAHIIFDSVEQDLASYGNSDHPPSNEDDRKVTIRS
eukprot:m.275119 g.275119  ORF g.275119 m.275119 type:complete len:256 (+) comp116460_c0_seq1:220-987(+)